ncbi:ribonuclease Z [Methanobrevibacter sp. 87.7]|uniref:ribonuclease Z n=1 Tax=Methanobrevibacter sp. 87.7 TaxID=387957 RepID=UPI000B5092FA|nr:ribonuclease Z [Methanobrevibacter sp. 87.7]OWT32347.1 ribonuclease Z [Methanobrevibacter sp. 87.7]
MEITFLGTASAIPSKNRNHVAIILKAFGEVILFDCGEGTQRQLEFANISPMKITKIFISHLHGDHILGLPGLIQSMGFRGREKPLTIYGPKGILKIKNCFFNNGFNPINFEVNVIEIKENGTIIENDEYIIKTSKTKHNLLNYSYSVEEKKKPRFLREKAISLGVEVGPDFGKLHNGEEVEVNGKIIKPEMVLGKPRKGIKITYSGDSRPCDAMVELAKDSTLLIHEATFLEEDKDKAYENGHSTTKEAAEIAKKANVNKLVITHFSNRYTNTKEFKKESEEIFKNTTVAKDFMQIIIKNKDEIKILK